MSLALPDVNENVMSFEHKCTFGSDPVHTNQLSAKWEGKEMAFSFNNASSTLKATDKQVKSNELNECRSVVSENFPDANPGRAQDRLKLSVGHRSSLVQKEQPSVAHV